MLLVDVVDLPYDKIQRILTLIKTTSPGIVPTVDMEIAKSQVLCVPS